MEDVVKLDVALPRSSAVGLLFTEYAAWFRTPCWQSGGFHFSSVFL